ncbi:hypothetical protein DW886_15335 [Enterocloster aldenensis]|uniref:PcfJ domain-containing protein n=1 Tax=Enterocloster aldenensis TaxID=358742 RepID=UPI000E482EE7|nr:hypothetical protein DW886_15335 [Enterocloster aldenensis]
MKFNKPEGFNAIFKIGSCYNIDANSYIQVSDDYRLNLPIIDLNRRVAELFIEKNKTLIASRLNNPERQLTDVELNIDSEKIIIRNYSILYRDGKDMYGHDYVPDERFLTELNWEEILKQVTFVISKYDKNVVTFKKYGLQQTECNEFTIAEVAKLELSIIDGHLMVHMEGIKNEENFFSGITDSIDMNDSLLNLVFDKYKTYPGMKDIYYPFMIELKKNYNNLNLDDYKTYMFYKNLFDDTFFYLMERRIKEGLHPEEIYDMNPVFTNKPFILPKDSLCKKAKEFVKKYNLRETNDIEALQENPQVGTAGLCLLLEFYENFVELRKKRDFGWLMRFDSYISCLNNIFTVFEVKPKTMVDKMIRYAFCDQNLSFSTYLRTVCDYAAMCHSLGIKTRSIPKDLQERHDQLISQIREIRNEELKQDFKEMAIKNMELLDILPKSDKYTIISPKNVDDLIKEGQSLNHCVGSYVSNFINGVSKIFFLRRLEDVENPFITIELNRHNDLIQMKGYTNSTPNKECRDYVVSWIGILGGSIYE